MGLNRTLIMNGVPVPSDLAEVISAHRAIFGGFEMADKPDALDIAERIGSDKAPTDEELAAAAGELKSALDLATKGDRPDLSIARDVRQALDKVTEELSVRAEALETARKEALALRQGLFDDEKSEDEDEGKGDKADPAKEPEKAAEPDPKPTTASFSDTIARLRAIQAADVATPKVPKALGITVKAIGPAAGFELGQDAGFAELGQMFSTHAKSLTQGASSLVRLERHFDESRQLGASADQNNAKIDSLLGPSTDPITAAGGLCGPGDVDHSHPICADRGRPVRDALVQFSATRGKITLAPSAGLGDVAGAVSVWTAETDANPGTAVKPCPPVTCPEDISESVDAVTRCLTIGNFQAKFSPELWASRLELLMALHDREAEQKAISEIHAASTALTAVTGGNTLANFLQSINRAIAYDRSVNRNLNGRFRVISDTWVRDAIRNQVIENLGVANNIDAIQVADATIAGWLQQVNADVTWTPDGTMNTAGTGHNLLASGNTFLPETTVYVFPQPAFLFLDGGTLDLGTSITDSALNATNDRQAFAETFEKVLFRGCSAYRIPVAVAEECGCPAPVAP